MMAARLRREHPDETPEELARRVDAWLTRQPCEAGEGLDAPEGLATDPPPR